jgi:hypothetical protein
MTIEIETAKKYYYTNLIYELHIAEEKLFLFKKKYQEDFDEFEKFLKNQKEDFLKWDDYLEWKAFRRVYDELGKNLSTS